MWPGSQLDAVGPLELLDPVVLDGDAVPRGEPVVLPGRAPSCARGRPATPRSRLPAARRQDLDHPRRGVVGVRHGMCVRWGFTRPVPRVRQQHAVADADPVLAGQHQRELVLPGTVAWLYEGPRLDLDLEHSHAPSGIGAFDLVVEPHAEELYGLPSPGATTLGLEAAAIADLPG